MTPTKTFPIDIDTYNKLCEVNAELVKALENALETIKFYDENYDTRMNYVDGKSLLDKLAKAKGAV